MNDIKVVCDCSDCSNNEDGLCTVEEVFISRDGECWTFDKKKGKSNEN
ncbi:MAG: hypothetical protein IKW90_15755 [Lachnospiraceae bacterium]|nr:hypothetical protein [Lachnospiraceae bacterium]